MLSAHPSIAICPETAFMSHWYTIRHWYGDLNVADHFDVFWKSYITQGRFPNVGVESDQVLKRIMKAKQVNLHTVFTATMEEYAARIGKPRWGEKSPGHEHHIVTLEKWYPSAKFLFLIRDPRAVYASMLNVPWGNKSVYWQATSWNDSLKVLEKYNAEQRVKAVKYEDLVQDPEVVLRSLCNFIGEDFDDGMIHNRSEITSPISGAIVKEWTKEHLKSTLAKPVTAKSINKWKSQLTAYEIEAIERLTDAQMRRYGYSRYNNGFTSGQVIYWFLVEKPKYSFHRCVKWLDCEARKLVRLIVPFSMMRSVRQVATFFGDRASKPK